MFVKVHDQSKIDIKFLKTVSDRDLPEKLINFDCFDLDMFIRIEKHLKEEFPDFELIDFQVIDPNDPDFENQYRAMDLNFVLLDKAYYNSPLTNGYQDNKNTIASIGHPGNIDDINVDEIK